MIIDFKTMFLQQWKLFKNTKTEVDFSVVSKEKWKEAGQWPATVPPFFPLVTRCVARQEQGGKYILLYNDALVVTDELTIHVLKLCDGINAPKTIKQLAKKDPRYTEIEDIEGKVEKILANAGKYGVINWIPFSQPHINKMQGDGA